MFLRAPAPSLAARVSVAMYPPDREALIDHESELFAQTKERIRLNGTRLAVAHRVVAEAGPRGRRC